MIPGNAGLNAHLGEQSCRMCVPPSPASPCLGAPCLVLPGEEMPLWVPVSHQPLSVVQACHLQGHCPPRSPCPCCLPAGTAPLPLLPAFWAEEPVSS